jgi:hypothetical protein
MKMLVNLYNIRTYEIIEFDVSPENAENPEIVFEIIRDLLEGAGDLEENEPILAKFSIVFKTGDKTIELRSPYHV